MTSSNQLELLQLDVPEVIDWSNLPWNNADNERSFTQAQRKEISLFRKQERFVVAKKERLIAYEQKLDELRCSFECAEVAFDRNNVNPFSLSIWTNDISETRKRAVPAYAFDKFLDLPKELQFMIWTKTMDIEERKTHILMCMSAEYIRMEERRKDVHNPLRSTSIFRPYYRGYGPSLDEGPVTLIQVCPDAHTAYRNVYTYMPCMGESSPLATHVYNTWSDEFYMGGSEWTDWKILIDMIIKQNTTRPIHKSVASDVAALQSIRHLTVDLNIFGGAPAYIWRQFPRLKVLTIAFYPYATIRDRDQSMNTGLDPYEDSLDISCNLVFTKPRRNKKFLKRAETISKLAIKSLRAVATEFPEWNVPRLEVVVKKSGIKEFDQDAEHGCKDYEEDAEKDAARNSEPAKVVPNKAEGGVDQESEIEVDDSAYLDQLPFRISHPPLSTEQIKRWKQRYHPSRERSFTDALMPGMTKCDANGQRKSSNLTPSYFADSEGTSDDERPFRTVDLGEDGYY